MGFADGSEAIAEAISDATEGHLNLCGACLPKR